MDDFGTGYASLSSLQAFPFDKIKIDRSFVSGVSSNVQSAAIVRTILSLGSALALPVIAEGVETEDERVFLMKEGCPEIQGYLVGHPHPIALYKDVTDGLSPGSALGDSAGSSAAAQAFGVTG
jgi:EAL domain-containing protein (putative c-di-GMP-specific phosphodiesterase class I)